MPLEAVAGAALAEGAAGAAASTEAVKEIVQKMAIDSLEQKGSSEIQQTMLDQQSLQEGFRVGETSDSRLENVDELTKCEFEAKEELAGKLGDVDSGLVENDEQSFDAHRVEGEDIPTYNLDSGKDAKLLNSEKYPENSMVVINNMEGGNTCRLRTDGKGNVEHIEYDRITLHPETDRDPYEQRRSCDIKDGVPGDDGGHALAREFGGSSQEYNLYPMNSDVNRHGHYRKMEKEIETALRNGHEVTDFKMDIYRDDGSRRPTGFDYSYKVDGQIHQGYIDNPKKEVVA